jgi:hypothetical protein
MSHDPNATPPAPHAPATVTLTEWSVAALGELLGICDEFLRTAGPNVHAELRGYLARQSPPADPGWLIDMLGFNALYLRQQLPAGAPSPRENHQPRGDQIDSGQVAR